MAWKSKTEVGELPLAKLFITIMQRLGVEADSFTDQSGALVGVSLSVEHAIF